MKTFASAILLPAALALFLASTSAEAQLSSVPRRTRKVAIEQPRILRKLEGSLSMPLAEAEMSMSFALSSLPSSTVGGIVAPVEEVPAVTAEVEAAAPTAETAAPPAETAANPPKEAATMESEMMSSSSAKSTAFAASLLGALITLW